jgi:hypothetical protein
VSGRVHTNAHGLKLHVGGRKRPTQTRASHPHLFRGLRALTLPPAPDFDNTVAAKVALSDILANDSLGDCTSAGAGHIIDSVTADAGAPAVITAAQAIAFYSQSTGYVPGDPSTDQGGDEITVCQSWQTKGYDGKGAHAIAGWAAFTDAELADPAFIKSVAYLFPLYFGIELADSWTQISGSGFVWDVGNPPDPNDGHCVVGLGGNSQGILIDTWGMTGVMTYAAIKQFCASGAGGNLFAILTPELIDKAKGKAPNGFDYDQLLADFEGMGGNAPPAPPAPAPPAPAPGSPATLANAQAAVSAAIGAGDALQTRQQAADAASAGLATLTGWPS